MNNRIREIRKNKGLTQAKFAEKLGIKQSYMAMIESGATEPTERIIKSICQEYAVNQDWLENGQGPMFKTDIREDDIMQLYIEIREKIPRRMLKRVKSFLKKAKNFTDEEWRMLEILADKILDE